MPPSPVSVTSRVPGRSRSSRTRGHHRGPAGRHFGSAYPCQARTLEPLGQEEREVFLDQCPQFGRGPEPLVRGSTIAFDLIEHLGQARVSLWGRFPDVNEAGLVGREAVFVFETG